MRGYGRCIACGRCDRGDAPRVLASKGTFRGTMGLVLAALIIGAALMMRVDTPFRLLGYPGLAVLLFLGACVGGVAQIFSILTGDKRRQHRPA